MKLSLTSGFVQKFASTSHSSLMMPAWELMQWKMARKHTYKPSTYRLDLVLLASKTATVQIESPVFLSSKHFKGDLLIDPLKNAFWSSASRKVPRKVRNLAVKGLMPLSRRGRFEAVFFLMDHFIQVTICLLDEAHG